MLVFLTEEKEKKISFGWRPNEEGRGVGWWIGDFLRAVRQGPKRDSVTAGREGGRRRLKTLWRLSHV